MFPLFTRPFPSLIETGKKVQGTELSVCAHAGYQHNYWQFDCCSNYSQTLLNKFDNAGSQLSFRWSTNNRLWYGAERARRQTGWICCWAHLEPRGTDNPGISTSCRKKGKGFLFERLSLIYWYLTHFESPIALRIW